MKSKKLISFFLFLVLSIQVLPLQQIAAWLFSSQLTEEIAHSISPVKAKSVVDDVHPPFAIHGYPSDAQSLLISALGNHPQDEAIHARHADDILTPPPNF